jgi:hypothetical protein
MARRDRSDLAAKFTPSGDEVTLSLQAVDARRRSACGTRVRGSRRRCSRVCSTRSRSESARWRGPTAGSARARARQGDHRAARRDVRGAREGRGRGAEFVVRLPLLERARRATRGARSGGPVRRHRRHREGPREVAGPSAEVDRGREERGASGEKMSGRRRRPTPPRPSNRHGIHVSVSPPRSAPTLRSKFALRRRAAPSRASTSSSPICTVPRSSAAISTSCRSNVEICS